MSTKRKATNWVVTSIRLPVETHQKLQETAAKDDVSVSGQIRLLVDEYLARAAA